MKLFIKRDISTGDSGFTVFDELGYEKYYAVFLKSKSTVKINLTDTKNNIVLKIRKLPMVGANTFVFKADKQQLSLVVVCSSKGIFCNYYGKNWHIQGEIASKHYSIIDVDNSVIASQKNCGESVEITIPDKSNELNCIATSICLSLINTVDKFAVQAV
ncbi:MAG: hypothetical protein U0L76_05055 [Ruminococcus sp.]|nr:hypothetical protein [Ruminococcus sp.]